VGVGVGGWWAIELQETKVKTNSVRDQAEKSKLLIRLIKQGKKQA